MAENNELKFVFPNEDIKTRFAIWLCDGGAEQAFMDLIIANGFPELDISYCDGNGNFLGDNTVRMKYIESNGEQNESKANG